MLHGITVNQIIFFAFIFLLGLIHQPNWVYENFWAKADFYDFIPFDVPFLVFAFVSSSVQTCLAWVGLKLIKKYL